MANIKFYTILFAIVQQGEPYMPQNDKYRTRIVPIEFEAHEEFTNFSCNSRVAFILLTNGKISIALNKTQFILTAPSVLLVSENDTIELLASSKLSAISFRFHPTFLNSSLTFEALKSNSFIELEDEHDRNMIGMFFNRDASYQGFINLPTHTFLRLFEWLSIIGTETFAQSDGYWTCRIRRYLLQSLYLIDDIHMALENGINSKKSNVDILLEYIHINYQNEISLDHLCKMMNSNRTSINRKFKEQTGTTVMDYVVHYRIKIACEALSHTNLSLNEIATACGFKYDTYFIKQFTKKMNITPTQYRQNFWSK